MRIIWFMALSLFTLIFPWWSALIAISVYTFRYTAYEAIVLGMLLDAYYGQPLVWMPFPILYTLPIVCIIFVIELIKPSLFFHKEAA